MLNFRFTLSSVYKKLLLSKLKNAEKIGNIRLVKHILAILALAEGKTMPEITTMLKITAETVRLWLRDYLLYGSKSLRKGKSPGRPAKLKKAEKKELAQMIEAGPQEAGFSGNCWRSPMIQHLIYQRYGLFYCVQYISQLLRSMGFSYQKAAFESDHLDKKARKIWLMEKWPEIMRLAEKKNVYVLFGDEASFPQWGTLSYTWSRRGKQYTIKTSGKRKSYKVFGLIDYFTGRFFYKCTQQRLNSVSYTEFLHDIISKTRKHIILIQDCARYHTSKATKEFFSKHKDRITVFSLPSYSPDYNPIEKLWKNIKKDHTHLVYFPTFESLIDKVEDALWQVANAPDSVLELFGFYDDDSMEKRKAA